LRAIIYPEVRTAPPPALAAARHAGYVLEDEQRVTFPVELASAAQIADLMTMTPHAHRATMAGRAALAELDRLRVTGDVVVRTLRRGAG
jgi:23S rRNA (guanine745-N1)-methyltransferase